MEYDFPNTERRIRIPFPTSYDPCIYTNMNIKSNQKEQSKGISSKFIEKFNQSKESKKSIAQQSPKSSPTLKDKIKELQQERKNIRRDDDPIVIYCKMKQNEEAQKSKEENPLKTDSKMNDNIPEIITHSNIVAPLIAFSQAKIF